MHDKIKEIKGISSRCMKGRDNGTTCVVFYWDNSIIIADTDSTAMHRTLSRVSYVAYSHAQCFLSCKFICRPSLTHEMSTPNVTRTSAWIYGYIGKCTSTLYFKMVDPQTSLPQYTHLAS